MAEKILKICDLAGSYQVTTEDGKSYNMRLPGTMADNGIGHRDSLSNVLDLNASDDPEEDPLNHILDEAGLLSPEQKNVRLTWEEEVIETRYTRRYAYEGSASISRYVNFESTEKELYLLVEAARELQVLIDNAPVPELFPGALPTPRLFDVSGKMNGQHTLTFISNNNYPEFPRSFVLRSNMASNDTQTNWNGLLGKIQLINQLPEWKKPAHARITVDDAQHFLLDGKRVFFYGETNCAIDPETGHMPMDEKTWELIFKTYADYGLNFVRFETYCPPEAAFSVADRMGFVIMVELSMNGLRTPILEKTKKYYQNELQSILKWFGHHPSFCFLSVGSSSAKNQEVRDFFASLIELGKETDPTKFYTAFCGDEIPNADFYLTRREQSFAEQLHKPVISECRMKTEILTDFSEIDLFSGTLLPVNLMNRAKKAEEAGLLPHWNEYLEAAGETALRNIKEDIQKVQWNGQSSGILFRSLQDYPGRNEYPHGFLTSHLQPKNFSFAKPEALREKLQTGFPIAHLERKIFEYGETLEASVKIFEEAAPADDSLTYELKGEQIFCQGTLNRSSEMTLTIPLEDAICKDAGENPKKPERCKLTLTYGTKKNAYDIFIYPAKIPFCPDLIYETEVLSPQVCAYLEQGGRVFFTPASRNRTGEQILYKAKNHPIFENFPSDAGTDEPWKIFSRKEGFLLPDQYPSLITVIDHQMTKEKKSLCFETRVGNGSIFVSGLSLKERMHTIEGRALLTAIYRYLSSFDFSPSQEMTFEELREITEQDPILGETDE